MFDQYLAFAALEAGMFSLAQHGSYLALNDPVLRDTQVEAAVTSVVDGLYAVLVTLGVVPIIRCPKVPPSPHSSPGILAGTGHNHRTGSCCKAHQEFCPNLGADPEHRRCQVHSDHSWGWVDGGGLGHHLQVHHGKFPSYLDRECRVVRQRR